MKRNSVNLNVTNEVFNERELIHLYSYTTSTLLFYKFEEPVT